MSRPASVSVRVLVVAVLVCLQVVAHSRAAETVDGPKLCQSLGFDKPVGASVVGRCTVICYSKDNSTVHHLERQGKCTWEGHKDSTCHFGECYESAQKPWYDEDDYALVEVIVKGYERNKSAKAINEPVDLDIWVAELPKDTITYGRNILICKVPTNNQAGAASIPLKLACRTRLLHLKAYVGTAIATKKHESLDSWDVFHVRKHLDKGSFILASDQGELTLELKRYESPNYKPTPRPTKFPNQKPMTRDWPELSPAGRGSSRRPKTSKKPRGDKKRNKKRTTSTTTKRPVDDEYE